jgi:hypothetical protein
VLEEINLLVFHAPPQPLDENVVHPAPAAEHADFHSDIQQTTGPFYRGELAALIGIEDFRSPTDGGYGTLQNFKTDADFHGVGGRPSPALFANTSPSPRTGRRIRQGFLGDGRLEIDNNLVENAIRPSAIGKKNCLFIGDVTAGDRSAVFYTLNANCQREGINANKYLTALFKRLPKATNQTVNELTPK